MTRADLAVLGQGLVAFGSLVVLPFLGVLALLKKRAWPVLVGALILWLAGGIALWAQARSGDPATRAASWTPETARIWLAGLGLGTALCVVAKLRQNRKVRKWLRVALGVMAVLAFAQGLYAFWRGYLMPPP